MHPEPWRPTARRFQADPPPGPVVERDALMKLASRIGAPDEDALLDVYIAAAVAHVERATGRLLAARTAWLMLPDFPPGCGQAIELPGGLVQSITAVTYVDDGGAVQTIAPEEYALEASDGAPALLRPTYGVIWPVTRPWALPVTVSYVAGWPAQGIPEDFGALVPAPLRTAVLMLAAELYERREIAIVGTIISRVPVGVDMLVAPWRVMSVG